MNKTGEFHPLYPPLSDKETRVAVADLVKYPRVLRSERDPPIAAQSHSLISWRLLTEPFVTPRGRKVFGLVKVRGVHADENLALRGAASIIKEVDSIDTVQIAETGGWVPITDDDCFTKNKFDAKIEDEEMVLRDLAKEEQRRKEDNMKKDLHERAATIRGEKDIHEDPTSLKFYCMKRVVEANLREEMMRKERMLREHKEKHNNVLKELLRLEQEHSNYVDEWIYMYNSERRSVNLPNFVITDKEREEYDESLKRLL